MKADVVRAVVVFMLLGLALLSASSSVEAQGWQVSTLHSEGDIGEHPSIALDSFGTAYVSYYDGSNHDLWVRAWNPTSHQPVVGLVASEGDVGLYSSIALNSTGAPRMSYYDKTNGDLIYARRPKPSPTEWMVFGLDSDGDVGQYVSLVIDSSNNVHIAYYDATHGDLKYVGFPDTQSDPSPFPVTVDSAGDVGLYASIGIDSFGHPHIIYYDATNGDLKHATKTGDSWITEIVDSEGDVGRHASLARVRGAGSLMSGVYYDSTNGDLKYAVFSGSWTTETVYSEGDVGQYASIALTPSGYPHIAFYDSTNGDLKHAVKEGGSWSVETVHSTGDVGQYASMDIDSSGFVHIVYYDATNGDLDYATNFPPASSLMPLVSFVSTMAVLLTARLRKSGLRRMTPEIRAGLLGGTQNLKYSCHLFTLSRR